MEQDCRKLGSVISSLKETVHLPPVIGVDNSGTQTQNIDTSFAVYPDYKSHTGSCLILGYMSLSSLSSKQKTNTNTTISIETELVGVDETMTMTFDM